VPKYHSTGILECYTTFFLAHLGYITDDVIQCAIANLDVVFADDHSFQ